VYGWTVTDGGTDTTGPVITLVGDSTITLFVGDGYEELGASAFDVSDGDVDVVISGTVDTRTEGSYTLIYSATDTAGNTSSVTRTINVILFSDTIAPVITFNGDSTITMVVGDSYEELGASAFDALDGAVDVVISGEVDTTAVGVYSLTYSASDTGGNTAIVTRTVNVGRPFITSWQTDTSFGFSDNNQITIGTQGDGYNYRIDWGDGHVDENVTGDITHTYDVAGLYTVSISGDFPQLYFEAQVYDDGDTYFYSDHRKLRSIEQWGDIQWRSMHRAFAGCENVIVNATDVPDLSGVSDMSYMFSGADNFNQDLSGWVVSNVTDMSAMFARASAFNQNISGWDVSNVTNMSAMFAIAGAFNQDLSSWDVSNVTDMSDMFVGASAFNQDLSNWNVSNVTDMSGMFFYAKVFNQDLSSWDVSNVTDLNSMFYAAKAFNQDLSSWDVSNVTDMRSMFEVADVFNQDLSSWDVSNVTDMRSMFDRAYVFNQDLSSWDVSNVTVMSSMFNGVTLSTANYNALLLGWSNLLLQENVGFNGGNSQYSSLSQDARDILIDVYGWTIIDGGVDD
jgi:surface protein